MEAFRREESGKKIRGRICRVQEKDVVLN